MSVILYVCPAKSEICLPICPANLLPPGGHPRAAGVLQFYRCVPIWPQNPTCGDIHHPSPYTKFEVDSTLLSFKNDTDKIVINLPRANCNIRGIVSFNYSVARNDLCVNKLFGPVIHLVEIEHQKDAEDKYSSHLTPRGSRDRVRIIRDHTCVPILIGT